jgi:dipeptidyl-peptidase-4
MRIKRTFLFALLLIVLTVPSAAQKKRLTLDDLFDPQRRVNFNGSLPRVSWLPDGAHFLHYNFNPERGPVGVRKVEAATGKSEPFHDAAKMEKALTAAGVDANEARRAATLFGATFNAAHTAALVEASGDLYVYEFGADAAKRLTDTPDIAEDEADFSPDGKTVSFVRGNNLFVVAVAGGKARQLTSDGGADIFNGVLDWVYEEEVYGRGKRRGYWWNPSSTAIAFLRLDDANVPTFTVIDDVPQGQRIENTKYPKVGDANPKVRLGTLNLSDGAVKFVSLDDSADPEVIVTRVGWTPSGEVLFQVQNRLQTTLDLNVAAFGDGPGAVRRLLREESQAWVDVVELPEFLPDGSFIWQSDRTGYRHLYHYAKDGTLIKRITSGDWDVRELYGLADGYAYFSAAEHSPIANHVYRVKLDGSGFARLSQTEGTHDADFNDRCTGYFDLFSAVNTPPQLRLHANDGREMRVIEENRVAALDAFEFSRPEFLQVKTRDGFAMEAMMIKPPDFDPNKKYPVWCYTYSGPGAQSVLDRWLGARYLWHQMLAQKGYIVWICDNRSASAKGVKSAHPIYKNLGELELRDLEDGIAHLKRQPYVDGSRIGLWGWSYGGYMTAYALTHSSTFKIGIVGAPVTDWRNYDSIYTERYMGLPKDNAQGYDRSSPLKAAANLNAKLLLLHGLIDDNVHPQNSVQFMDALQKAGKRFEFMAYPQSRHGIANPLRVRHQYMTMTRFIEENL